MESWPFQLLLVAVTLVAVGAQAWRVHRHGAAGVAVSTWLGLSASTALWLAYGVTLGDVALIATNVPAFGISVVIIATLVRAGAAAWRQLGLTLVAVAGFVVVSVLLLGNFALGAAASAFLVGRIFPQLWAAVRAPDVRGVSLVTWVGNALTKAPWALYGLAIGDLWVGGSALLGVVVSLLIVVVVAVRRRGTRVGESGRTAGAVTRPR